MGSDSDKGGPRGFSVGLQEGLVLFFYVKEFGVTNGWVLLALEVVKYPI